MISSVIAVISSIGGFYLALTLDIAPTGPIASTAGAVFLLVFAFAPKRGFIATWVKRIRQKQATIDGLILESIARQKAQSASATSVGDLLGLAPGVIRRSITRLHNQQLIQQAQNELRLTTSGSDYLKAMA